MTLLPLGAWPRRLLVLAGLALVGSLAVLGYRRFGARQAQLRTAAVVAREARARTAETAARRVSDSAAAFAAGRRAELSRTLTSLHHRDDSLTRLRSATSVLLPAEPPRE